MAFSDRKRDSETPLVQNSDTFTGTESIEIDVNGVIKSITLHQLKEALASIS